MARRSIRSETSGEKRRLLRAEPLETDPAAGAAEGPQGTSTEAPAVPQQPAAPIPITPSADSAGPGPAPANPTPSPVSASPAVNQPAEPLAPIPLQPGAGSAPATSSGRAADASIAPAGRSASGAQGASAGRAGVAAPIPLTEEQKRQRGATVTEQKWQPGRKARGVREEIEEGAEEGWAAVFFERLWAQHRSWAVSAAVHMLLLIVLALWIMDVPRVEVLLLTSDPLPDQALETLDEPIVEGPKVELRGGDIVDRVEPEPLEPMVDNQLAAEGINAGGPLELVDNSLDHVPFNDLLTQAGRGTGVLDQPGTGKGLRGTGYGLHGTGGGLGGRGGRRGNAIGNGATKQSEEAVDLALKWLAEHQLPDGSWSFNHQLAPSCQGKCPDPGRLAEARAAATAMGVLPFLGAGQTNQVGKYQKTVAAGLIYLIRNMRVSPDGGRLNHMGGRMYAHGLATIALCEAYGMQLTKQQLRELNATRLGQVSPGEAPKRPDIPEPIPVPRLGQAAQAALNYVMFAQDPQGGGWRYEPHQPGDTSVVGWQLMALMSGRMAYLRVGRNSLLGASVFLDHVQCDDYGADYGYTGPEKHTPATQAIGLLCRMYLGWKHDHPGLLEGCRQLSQRGPQRGKMYYNYYATQVLHHFGGEEWKQWNERMRPQLVGDQSKQGHTAGSWYYAGADHGGSQGGRLYYTSLAAMTLEVYYRHMPLYKKDALGEAPAQGEKQPAEGEPEEDVFKL